MAASKDFKLTKKQTELIASLNDNNKAIYNLLFGGSRSGKTFLLCYAIVVRALKCTSRHVIIRLHFNAAKQKIGMDTMPKVLELFPSIPQLSKSVKINKQDWVFYIPAADGGTSEIWLAGLDDKARSEKILGAEYATIYFNELSEISYSSFQIAITRLAQLTKLVNKIYADCNPPTKSHWAYKVFVEYQNPTNKEPLNQEDYFSAMVNPQDNEENVQAGYQKMLGGLSTRERARFLYGQWLDDSEYALWSYSLIDQYRINKEDQLVKDLKRIVIGVDPSGTSNKASDEVGIICVGQGQNNHYYVLEDASGVYTPNEWGAKIANLYERWRADRVVAEGNYGGDMVEAIIRNAYRNISYRKVTATRGKVVRAEPIAALYEQGKVHHVGIFAELENEQCTYEANSAIKQDSPNRMDALVWGITDIEQNSKACILDYL
tara:strand:+ start:2357 stop:3658 length:1302 start_codon:yes stop_codon:yes gene_type:complete